MTPEIIERIVGRCLDHPGEDECLEFKHNNADPDSIGEYISALANSAAIAGLPNAYLIWGVADDSKKVVGTDFNFRLKVKQQPLSIYLASKLKPDITFNFYETTLNEHRVVLLEISSASSSPISYNGVEYIRIGESKCSLKDKVDHERKIWQSFGRTPPEKQAAQTELLESEVISLIDYPSYFKLTKQQLPQSRRGILEALERECLVSRSPTGWQLTVAGALLFANDLTRIPNVSRKYLRVVVYNGNSRSDIRRKSDYTEGYAISFQNAVRFICEQVPVATRLDQIERIETSAIPEIAIRELLANALIHQDLSYSGRAPLVEIFDNRLEISNPGSPLVEPHRFADAPPRSRNEMLAALMRRLGYCEELGSGIDRVLSLIEVNSLPPLQIEVPAQSTVVTVFGPRTYSEMTSDERIRACYWHAVLRWISKEVLTNSSLRKRFEDAPDQSQISRLIADAVKAKLIRRDPPDDTSKRHARYVPIWA